VQVLYDGEMLVQYGFAELLAQQQQSEDSRELHLWGGQRPTDQLRAIGWPTVRAQLGPG
jgi:hypothetical protein